MIDYKRLLPQEKILVDSLEEYKPKKIVGGTYTIKKEEVMLANINERFIVSSSSIFEVMTQFSGIILFEKAEKIAKGGFLYSVEKLIFKKMVSLGDLLYVKSILKAKVENIYIINCSVYCNNELVAKGQFNYLLTN